MFSTHEQVQRYIELLTNVIWQYQGQHILNWEWIPHQSHIPIIPENAQAAYYAIWFFYGD